MTSGLARAAEIGSLVSALTHIWRSRLSLAVIARELGADKAYTLARTLAGASHAAMAREEEDPGASASSPGRASS